MKLPIKSIPSFMLMLAGAMGFGSLYSALFNTVGREIIPIFFVLILMPILFMYAGFYSYNFLAYEKGGKVKAFIMVFICALLATASMIGGKSDVQIWFAFHEILNLTSAWLATIILGISFRK